MTDKLATVFVAEDNPILLQGLVRALTGSGYAVESAEDGLQLMETLQKDGSRPDLLLLDVMMPGMGGLEVLEAVKSDGRWPALPVVLITAATDEFVDKALEKGAVDVLAKPFRLSELLKRIDVHIREYQECRATR